MFSGGAYESYKLHVNKMGSFPRRGRDPTGTKKTPEPAGTNSGVNMNQFN